VHCRCLVRKVVPFSGELPAALCGTDMSVRPDSQNSVTTIISTVAALLLLVPTAFAADVYWSGGDSANGWSGSNNWGGADPGPATDKDLHFAGSQDPSPVNDYGEWSDWRHIYFDSGAASFTVTGAAIDWFGKIENNSANPQTINLDSLSIKQAGGGELNPVSGDLALGGGGDIWNDNSSTLHVGGNNGHTLTIGMNYQGGGGLTIEQNSTVVLNAANTYSGESIIAAGQLHVGHSNALAGGGVVRVGPDGGAVAAKLMITSGGVSVGNPVVVRAGAAPREVGGLNTSGTASYTGEITLDNDVTLTATGGGTVAFATVQDGLGGGGHGCATYAPSSTIRFSGATANGTANSGIASYTVQEGTLELAKDSGVNAISADIDIEDGGTLLLAQTHQIDNLKDVEVELGGNFDLAGHDEEVGSIHGAGVVSLGTARLTSGGNHVSGTLSGIISGIGGSLEKKGSGTLALSAENTFGGDGGQVSIVGGTLQVDDDDNLGTDPSSTDADYITLDNWGILRATGGFALNSRKGIQLNGNGKICVDDGETLSYNGDITGNHEFAKDGLGTLRLDTDADISASAIYIDAGTLWAKHTQPFDGSATHVNLGALSGSDPATFMFGYTTGLHLEEGITVRGGGTGTRTIANASASGDDAFDGQIVLHTNLTFLASSGGTITISGGVDMSGTGNQVLTITGADDVIISGTIEADTSAAEINHNGTGALILSGDNAVGVNQMMINIGGIGTVQVSDADGLGEDPAGAYPDKVNFLASGTLYNTVDVSLTCDAGMTIADGVRGTFHVGDGPADDLIINGVISDGGSNDGQVLKNGPGTLYLLGVNTYDGATVVSNGTVRIQADSGLGDEPGAETDGHLTLDGGRLLLANSSDAIRGNRNIELGAGHGTLSALSHKTLTVNSKIKGAGNLIIDTAATGPIVLAGVNEFTGNTTIHSGTLRISADRGLGQDPGSPTPDKITLDGGTLQATATFELDSDRGIAIGAGNGTISVNNGAELTYDGIIAGGGAALTKEGSGTLVLTGANTYSGGTTVRAGALVVNGSIATSLGVTVNGGNIGGTGTVPDLTLAGGGVSPGASVGTLTAGAAEWGEDSSYVWEINDFSGAYGSSPGWDKLDVTGALTISSGVGNKFTIRIRSLNGALPGQAARFDNALGYTQSIATATSIAGFDVTDFTVDDSNFQNAMNGGTWAVQKTGNDIEVVFTAAPVASESKGSTFLFR